MWTQCNHQNTVCVQTYRFVYTETSNSVNKTKCYAHICLWNRLYWILIILKYTVFYTSQLIMWFITLILLSHCVILSDLFGCIYTLGSRYIYIVFLNCIQKIHSKNRMLLLRTRLVYSAALIAQAGFSCVSYNVGNSKNTWG